MDAFKAAQDKFNRQKLERDVDLRELASRYESDRQAILVQFLKARGAYLETVNGLRKADAKKAV